MGNCSDKAYIKQDAMPAMGILFYNNQKCCNIAMFAQLPSQKTQGEFHSCSHR